MHKKELKMVYKRALTDILKRYTSFRVVGVLVPGDREKRH